MRLFLCFVFAWMPVAQALAAEGFFVDSKPPAVRAIWPSVYALQCETRKGAYVASAFLVAKVEKDRPGVRHRRRADYYFVTAGHAISACKGRRSTLAENLDQPEFEADGITVARPPLRLRSPKVVTVDDAYDIAIVKVLAASSTDVGAPIAVDGHCDRALHREIYAVGFPGVGKRRSLHLKREEKRWSKGEYVGLGRADFRGATSTYIASSVDSLPGSSGGPVVNEKGALVGVVAQGAAGADNKFRYDVDPKNPNDWQTFLVPCGAVLRILYKSGIE